MLQFESRVNFRFHPSSPVIPQAFTLTSTLRYAFKTLICLNKKFWDQGISFNTENDSLYLKCLTCQGIIYYRFVTSKTT